MKISVTSTLVACHYVCVLTALKCDSGNISMIISSVSSSQKCNKSVERDFGISFYMCCHAQFNP